MKSKGNGKPEQCVANLLLITRGEVPFERLKGLDASLINKPSGIVSQKLRADAEWLLRTYEPRVSLNEIDLISVLAKEGQFDIGAVVSKN